MPAVAYHYDVKITPERPKKFYRQAFEQYRVEHLGGAIAAFDGRASCYSVVKLKCSSQGQEVKVTDRHGRTLNYTLELKETEDLEVDLNSLRSFGFLFVSCLLASSFYSRMFCSFLFGRVIMNMNVECPYLCRFV
ncbi:protein argonaute-2-like isoform X3 [Drosophila pseudoobscura]|uniref:Protein argonaute-2-like isoform X1 n=1 Tax=Drosophila pseudoobscura pseudoobscura TaxID=46245 RepID=A0A6I8W5I4_DROPS|nr:protein argonaute-2 isoform X1 [Drosophila pseudoobscura]XP_033237944.1 protein argonaute-2 isoform X3 [Drosophila pseudoobscura]